MIPPSGSQSSGTQLSLLNKEQEYIYIYCPELDPIETKYGFIRPYILKLPVSFLQAADKAKMSRTIQQVTVCSVIDSVSLARGE